MQVPTAVLKPRLLGALGAPALPGQHRRERPRERAEPGAESGAVPGAESGAGRVGSGTGTGQSRERPRRAPGSGLPELARAPEINQLTQVLGYERERIDSVNCGTVLSEREDN